MSLPHGGTLGPYRILETLGRGGMATVFRAAHELTGAEVALKTVAADNERLVQSIRREVQALARLRHPGVVGIVDDGLHEGIPWYAMELVEGVTLGNVCELAGTTAPAAGADAARTTWWTRTLGDVSAEVSTATPRVVQRWELPRLLGVARALCASLAYLHGEGVVHRDLKPDNVMLRVDGTPVIVDFGLASTTRTPTHEALEVRADLAGTAAYMAPEVIRGGPVDARADLYALGCMLYEMVTGTRPFAAFTTAAVLRGHLELVPRPPSELVPDLPPALDELVLRLLEKVPARRLGHADDVARVLEALGAPALPQEGPPARDYLYRPGLVGRAGPLAALDEQLVRSRGRRGGLVVIVGESGVGKTRLVNELASRAAARGVTVLDGEASAVGPRALGALRRPLLALVDRCRARGPAEAARIFGPRAAILLPFAPELATLEGLPLLVEPAPLASDAGRLRVVRALAETLAAAASEPLLLVVDDLQWADGLTLDLLAYLARDVLPRTSLLVLATERREETSEALERLRALGTTVALDRLDREHVHALVAEMLANESPTALVELVARHSEGNPFFVAEYLRDALEAGLLRRDAAGAWQLDAPTNDLVLPLPSALRELVGRRLSALSSDARGLVDRACVMGRAVELAWLTRLAPPSDERALFAALDELEGRHVLLEGADGRLHFTHDKLREVAYEALAPDVRRALHRAVAEALPADELDALAHHWSRAGDARRAVEASHRAGEEALRRWAFQRAADHHRHALALAPEDPRRATWEHRLAEALLGLGDVRRGQAHLVRSLELRGASSAASGTDLARSLARGVVGQLRWRLGPASAALRAPTNARLGARRGEPHESSDLHAARPDPRSSSELLDTTRIHQRLVEAYWFDNDVARMLASGLQALNLAESAGPSPELVRAYATMCLAAGGLPIHPLAEHYADLSMHAAAHVGDPAAEGYALFLTSVYRVGVGHFDRVERDLERAVSLCGKIGDSRFLGESLTVIAMTHLYRGDFARADEIFAEVGQVGRRFDNLQHRIWSALGRSEALGASNDEGARQLELARTWIASGPTASLERFRFHGLAASHHLDRGELSRAEDEARLASHEGRALVVPTAHYLLEGYAGVARTRLATWRERGDRDAAREARRALRAMRRFAFFFRIGGPRADALHGDAEAIAGRAEAAERAWRRAAERAPSSACERRRRARASDAVFSARDAHPHPRSRRLDERARDRAWAPRGARARGLATV